MIDGTASCGTFEPTGPVTASDLLVEGLAELTIDGTTIDLVRGEIVQGANVVRQASDPALKEQKNGIVFWRTPEAVVIEARTILFQGAPPTWNHGDAPGLPLILVATESITFANVIDLECGRFGGAVAARALKDGAGPTFGPGASESTNGGAVGNGAAGGTHGGRGGAGGLASWTVKAPVPDPGFLFGGGSGGGGGGDTAPLPTSYNGGGGGAAIQLVARHTIAFGSSDGAATGLSAHGCPGKGTFSGGPQLRSTGAGGGAGGFILLEAPHVTTTSATRIAANGGGGGAQKDGDAATSNASRAGGGPATTCTGAGGAGGAGEEPDGIAGSPAPAPVPAACTKGVGGGGGGGAAGRIVFFTAAGTGPEAMDGAAPLISPSGAAQRRGKLTAQQ